MNGYVENLTNVYKYAFKMHLKPGQQISLDELYQLYGVKHGIEEGLEFAEWVRNVKAKDPKTWAVVFEGVNIMPSRITETAAPVREIRKMRVDGKILNVSDAPIDLPRPSGNKAKIRQTSQVPFKPKEKITDNDILNIEIGPNTKRELAKINDVKALKYALNKAKVMPGKALLMKLIKDRLSEIVHNQF